MTDHNATPANDTALRERDFSLESVKRRLEAFCTHFQVDPPKLKTRNGSVYLTDELIAWHDQNGASMDWILWGDALGMASTYREKHALKAEVRGALKSFDESEKRILADVLKGFQAAIEAKRAAA
jgi:hypothetical protein